MKSWEHYYARGIGLGWHPMYAAWAADRQVEGRSIASLSKLRKELQRQAISGDETFPMSAYMSGSEDET